MAESDAQQLIADVAESFGGGIDKYLANYADPVVVAGSEATLALDHDAATGVFDEMCAQLREQGLDRTEVRVVDVAMLGIDMALTGASLDRLRSDGSLIETIQAALPS